VKKANFYLKIVLLTIFNVAVIGIFLIFTFNSPQFLRLENVQISHISEDFINIKSDAIFNNNNFYSIKGKNLAINTYYEDILLAKSVIKELNLNANKESISKNSVVLSLSQLSKKWNHFIGKDSLELKSEITGYFGPLNFNYKTQFKYTIPSRTIIENFIAQVMQKQSFKIQNFRLEKLGLKEWLWNFDIQIFNQNPFDLVLKKINVKVFAKKDEKNEIGSWNYNSSEIILTEGDNKVISGQFKTTLGGTISTFLSKINDPNLIFYVNSKIEVVINNQIFKIPYKLKVKIDPFTRKISIIK
jgi:hypothetical protein